MKRLLLAVLALVLVGGIAHARPETGSADTTAVVINTRDGSSVFRFAFQIRRVAGDVVDEANAAVAFASCESCQTVAISIQAVLVMDDPSIVTPTNLALAYNYECVLCDTLASAYQFVLGTDGPVHFSAEGNQAIAQIHRELQQLRNGELSNAEIQARVDGLAQRLAQVLATELVAAGPPPQETPAEPPGGTTTTTAPEPGTTATTSETTTAPTTTEATTTAPTTTTETTTAPGTTTTTTP